MTKRVGAILAALALSVACAKQGDEAPSQTAASESPAPGAVPASPEAQATPPPPAPPPGAAPPTSLTEEGEAADEPGLKKEEPEPQTLAEAEALFKTSSADLEKLVGPLKADKATGGAAPAPLASGDARCPKACKAFASLERAGDAICRLAGDKDARCTRAKDVVKQNATRVAACGCES